MTPAADTIRHPDVSEISDLTEGLLSPARTAEVRRHLGDCPLCADVHASLEEIRSLLGTLPGPPRMPADIAGRIDAALAAEALLASTTPRAGDRPSAAPHGDPDALPGAVRAEAPGTPPGPGGRRPAGHPVGASGPGRGRARRRIAVLGGLAAAAACALGVFLAGNLSGNGSPDTAARHATTSENPPATAAGGYSAQGLPDDVRRLLAAGPGAKASTTEGNRTYGLENTPAAPGLIPGERSGTDAAAVPPCVQQGTGRPDTPLAAELGSYEGAKVYLLVLPHPGDPERVDAYVIGTDCADTPAGGPGKPLLTRTYPRS
ncbi:hypothetical protein AB0953_01045 [Streptomyces sp. NPDC046866]|uniref:anti-sigma factor family protein n=1 Tax=Streptomyces sp. NPDC046866 TaxID=3154921 RepID=UPI0034562C62